MEPILTTDNLIEYADPVSYDLENNSFAPDGPFFLALAQRFGGPILEIGCGTGRITIPLAQQGLNITGLDITAPMLDRAKHKSQGLPIRWIEADARMFRLETCYRFIFETGATFQHLLARADQEAMLARVHEHLTSDGHFVVGAIFPAISMLTDVETEQDWYSYLNGQGQEVRVSGTEHYDPVRQIKTETAYRRWRAASGQEVVRLAPLMLRYIFPQEMETLLHYNGFRIVEQYGGLDFSPLTGESRQMIYVCRKAE
jgi:SAM-dependent methyltransferase